MNEKELRKLIEENLKSGIKKEEFELDSNDMYDVEKDFDLGSDDISDIDPISMSDVDMPIKDKAVFSAMGSEEEIDDFSDLLSRYKIQGGDYEGGYEDDAPVSPGYFNEGKTIQITKEQLQRIIKEGVEQLHKKTLIENRIEQINQELNALNNPDAWEDAHREAQNQLRKKTIAFNNMIPRERLINEGIVHSSKIDLKSKLDDALYGWDSENSDFGYLHREKMLQGKVSPKQMIDRISGVIDDLNAYTKELESRKSDFYTYTQNPDYEKVWGSVEGGKMFESKYSDAAQDFIGKEISHLIKDKGYKHDRAVAAAINIAREKGYKVPKELEEKWNKM